MRRMQRAQQIAVRLEEGSLEVSGVLGDALSNCSSCSGTLRINFSSEGYLDFPLQPGDPTKCMHFAGSPIRAFLPRFVVFRRALSSCSSCSKTLRISCSSEGELEFPPPSLRAFLPRVRTSAVLASCGTNCTFLQKFLISHQHNRAENCTYRKPGTGGGIRRSRTMPVPT